MIKSGHPTDKTGLWCKPRSWYEKTVWTPSEWSNPLNHQVLKELNLILKSVWHVWEERDVGWRIYGMDFFETKVQRCLQSPRPVFISFAIRSATPIALIRRGCVMMMFASEGLRAMPSVQNETVNAQHFYAFCADLIIFCEWSCWCDVEQPSSCTSMALGKPILKNEPHKKKKNTWSEQNVEKFMKRNDKENQSNYKWKGLMFFAHANFEVYSWIFLACLNALESFPKIVVPDKHVYRRCNKKINEKLL